MSGDTSDDERPRVDEIGMIRRIDDGDNQDVKRAKKLEAKNPTGPLLFAQLRAKVRILGLHRVEFFQERHLLCLLRVTHRFNFFSSLG